MAISLIKVAAGEHCQNRIMFKQFLKCGAGDICHINSCVVGGVNNVLSILLLAAKFDVPVCPHAGGVRLCEYLQHLSMIDYTCISGSLENRMVVYIDNLHEHFVEPVIIKNGNYMPPKAPGHSLTMKMSSSDAYACPEGEMREAGSRRKQ